MLACASIIAQPIESQGNKNFFSTIMQGNYAGFAGVDIFKAGNDASFSRDQIKRAKYRISAVGRREGLGDDGQWIWRLQAGAFSH